MSALPTLKGLLAGPAAPASLAAVGSALFCLVAIATNPPLQFDSVLYLELAGRMTHLGLAESHRLFHWPFYPRMIAVLHQATGLSLTAAGHLLNTVLLSVASAAFVLLTARCGASRRAQFLAVVVVLCHPGINLYRGLVIRDFGFWACVLVSPLCLARFAERRSLGAALAWTATGLFGFLFRPEAMAVMAAAPIALFLSGSGTRRERAGQVGTLLIPLLSLLSVVLAWGLLAPGARLVLFEFIRNLGVWLSVDLSGNLVRSAHALSESFPPLGRGGGREYAPYIIASGLAAVLLVKVVQATGLVYLALVLWGVRQPKPADDVARVVRSSVWWSVTALTVLCYLFMLWLLFLERRYAVPISLLLSVFAPFAMEPLARLEGARRFAAWIVLGVGVVLGLLPLW